jgi:hypothetical protein
MHKTVFTECQSVSLGADVASCKPTMQLRATDISQGLAVMSVTETYCFDPICWAFANNVIIGQQSEGLKDAAFALPSGASKVLC